MRLTTSTYCLLMAMAAPLIAAEKPAAPSLTRAEPRGLQRGVSTRVKLAGDHLAGPLELKWHHAGITGKVVPDPSAGKNAVFAEITPAASLPRGAYELSISNTHGESARIKLFVEDLPQSHEAATSLALPSSAWGVLAMPGEVDEFRFNAKSGQTLVFDLAARPLGSKAANLTLALLDEAGVILGTSGGSGGSEPLLTHTFPRTGTYRVRVADQQLAASAEHFYRLSIGEFALVTGIYPLSLPVGTGRFVELIGVNLPAHTRVAVNASAPGESSVPISAEKFRARADFKVMITAESELLEAEPNDVPGQATAMIAPGAVHGRIQTKSGAADSDLFRFHSKAGEAWVLETLAARRGSPVDTKIEILHPDGRPVPRLLLQAVRDSAVTFRGVDANNADIRLEKWEEMELNELVYFQGEVCRIFRMPRGPDAGFLFYTAAGKRKGFFDTTATALALDTTCYTVVPQPLGTRPVPNGLPIFTVNYTNDDDAERRLGADSRLFFTAPAEGDYLVRVTDSRALSGDRFVYRLALRRAEPDFSITLAGATPSLVRDSGKGFTLRASRQDGFEGAIRVEFSGVPAGFTLSNPITIEAGHTEADGTLYALPDKTTPPGAAADWSRLKAVAVAQVSGRTMTHAFPAFASVQVATAAPKVFLDLENFPARPDRQPVVIAPGQTVSVLLKIRRNGNNDIVSLDVDNLPHGVIVDNIGLNGVQIAAGESEREVFLTCAKWVEEQDRPFHAVLGSARSTTGNEGKQTSLPLLLQVRRPAISNR
jgi:hypothetical protein